MTEPPIAWKNGARCAIMLSFDLDGETLWMARDPALAERLIHMSMGAYGPKTAMPRILRLLDRYGLKVAFYVPGWIIEHYPAVIEEIVRRGHELGHHGYLHEKPFTLASAEEEEALLVRTLEIFKRRVGVTPLGSRTPSADPSRHTFGLLKKHGFVYHTNMMDADLPYRHATPHGDLVELPTSWVNDDFMYFGFSAHPPAGNGIWSQQDVWEIWSEEFEGQYEEGGFYNLMFHPQVMGRPSRMRMLERLIQRMLGKGDVWFAKPIDLAQYWLAQGR
jgi:peptidoglycan/xylan/chitin deacetylase (PgdA/CDA1 family)